MFDSGFGGLTVARAVIDLLPNEHLVYFGDTGRYPYGSKPQGDVAKYALEIADFLVAECDIKMLVVACNTAAAAAFDELTANGSSIPVVGVIEPGVRSLAPGDRHRTGRRDRNGRHHRLGAYQHTLATIPNTEHVALTALACPGFVEFVERGETSGRQVEVLAKRLLAPMVDASRRQRCCSAAPTIRSWPGPSGTSWDRDVVLVSSADETAFDITGSSTSSRCRVAPAARSEHRRFVSSRRHCVVRRSRSPSCSVPSWPGPRPTEWVTERHDRSRLLGQLRSRRRCLHRIPHRDAEATSVARRRPRHARPISNATSTPADLDAVVLTHEHPDHWLEIPVFVNVLKHFTRPSDAYRCSSLPVPPAVLRRCRHRRPGTGRTGRPSPHRRNERGGHRRSAVALQSNRSPGGDPRRPRDRRRGHLRLHLRHRTRLGPSLRSAGRSSWPSPSRHLPDRETGARFAHLTARRGGGAGGRAAGVEQLVLTHLPSRVRSGSTTAPRRAHGLRSPGRVAQVGATFSTSDTHDNEERRNDPTRRPRSDELRPVIFARDFTSMAAGSVLVSFGETQVLCTASVDDDVPRWMRGTGKGWVTAEYSMLPGSTARAGRTARRLVATRVAAPRRSSGSSAARCAAVTT